MIENGTNPNNLFPPVEGGVGQEIPFNNILNGPPPPQNNFDVINGKRPFVLPNIDNNGAIGNNLFGSIGLMKGLREKEKEETTNKEIDDFLYELPDVRMPTLELGDKFLNIF